MALSAVPRGAPVRSSLMDALEPSLRDAVAERLRPRTYRRGQVAFNDGDHGDCLHLLECGRMSVTVNSFDGQPIIVRVVHPGEFFGELALVHPDHRRLGRVCALEPAETFALHRSDFEELRADCPGLDRLLVTALAERVAMTTRLLAELSRPPGARLWRQLANLADDYGDEPIRMSQDELAHTAGTARQTANRVLQEGVRRGALTVERCTIRVLDREWVEQMANG
jgi:CRP/FNR family cyclic AMP-dependent transcriptional regulator